MTHTRKHKHKLKLEPLEMLDLSKCHTVGQIVDGMSRCSFGARMLGQVAATLTRWCQEQEKPIIIHDLTRRSRVLLELNLMVSTGFFAELIPVEQYQPRQYAQRKALVVGGLSERQAAIIFKSRQAETVFINENDLVKPGQVKDGYFPGAVFADPRLIIPILYFVLLERLRGERHPVADLIDHLNGFGGVAAQVVKGARTSLKMMRDKRCFRFVTLSGAMTIAQMSLVICEMIERGIANCLTSTGALMAHGLMPGLGLNHFKYNPADDDQALARRGLNRVTDTLEPETNFDQLDVIMGKVLDGFNGDTPISPSILHRAIGQYLVEQYPDQRSILSSAYRCGVPVFVPAFVDSELGNDVFVSNLEREWLGRKKLLMDMELDTAELVRLMLSAKRAGIITWGGGVPRNNVQNVAPLLEIALSRLKKYPKLCRRLRLIIKKFRTGCRVCPDKMYYGHLGGCTYKENQSWRKMDPRGMFAEILADSTIVWPFLIKYIMDWQDRKAFRRTSKRAA